MANPARRLATYEDVLNAPAHMVAEVVSSLFPIWPGGVAREWVMVTLMFRF